MIAEVATVVIVVVSAVDMLVISKSVAKVADASEIAKKKNQFAHFVVQQRQSQSMKIVLFVQNAQCAKSVLFAKSVQLAPLEPIVIQNQNALRNQIVPQR
jgi:hypothetical protein